MSWLPLIACFFGGLFLANAVPHAVSGMQGRAFQSPFAKPPGEGLSSSTINVAWGFLNIAFGYVLLRRGRFEITDTADALAVFAGALVIALFSSRHFGRFHGGTTP